MTVMGGIITAGAIALTALSLAPLVFARPGRRADLASHFLFQGLIASGLLLCAVVLWRVPGWAGTLALSAYILFFVQVFPLLRRGKAALKAPALRLLCANVWVKNRETGRLAGLIAREKPDIVGLVEVNGPCAALCESLKAEYPHQRVVARDDASSGIALLSRLPLEDLTQVDLSPGRPALTARVQGLHVTLLHAANPTYDFEGRERDFATLRALPVSGPRVVMGDFNATPYCLSFRDLCRALGLVHGRLGRGVLGSFPVAGRVSWLRLPIDHVLAGGGARIADFRLGPDIGSDHMPVIAEIEK